MDDSESSEDYGTSPLHERYMERIGGGEAPPSTSTGSGVSYSDYKQQQRAGSATAAGDVEKLTFTFQHAITDPNRPVSFLLKNVANTAKGKPELVEAFQKGRLRGPALELVVATTSPV